MRKAAEWPAMNELVNVFDKAIDYALLAIAGFVGWLFKRSIDHGERLRSVETAAVGASESLKRIEEQNSKILDTLLRNE